MAVSDTDREHKRTLVRIGVLAALILGITALHYFTGTDQHYYHDIYRRLYYLPIVLAGLWFALRGGVAAGQRSSVHECWTGCRLAAPAAVGG